MTSCQTTPWYQRHGPNSLSPLPCVSRRHRPHSSCQTQRARLACHPCARRYCSPPIHAPPFVDAGSPTSARPPRRHWHDHRRASLWRTPSEPPPSVPRDSPRALKPCVCSTHRMCAVTTRRKRCKQDCRGRCWSSCGSTNPESSVAWPLNAAADRPASIGPPAVSRWPTASRLDLVGAVRVCPSRFEYPRLANDR